MRSRASRAARGCALAGAVFVFVAAVAFAGFELYLRGPGARTLGVPAVLPGLCENDGAGSIRTVAGFRASLVVDGRTTQIRINALGLRGPELAEKAAGERRLLALGDSMVFGMGVEDDEAFPALLARDLSRSLGGRVTAGNGGIPGNGTLEQVRDLRRHLPTFGPDVVLACIYLGNDFDDDVFGPKEVVEGLVFATGGARFAKSSWRTRLAVRSRVALNVELWLAARFPSLAIDRSSLAATPEETARSEGLPQNRTPGIFMDADVETPGMRQVLDRVEDAIAAMRDFARPKEVVAVILPSWAHVLPEVYEEHVRAFGLEPSAPRVGRVQTRIAERCARAGVACADLTPSMREHADPHGLFIPADFHFSRSGHEFVASVLEPVVREKLAALR